jgi:hypothetical protein
MIFLILAAALLMAPNTPTSAQRCQSLMEEFRSSVSYIEVEMSNPRSGAVKFSRGTAYNSVMQLPASDPRKYRVLMSFR